MIRQEEPDEALTARLRKHVDVLAELIGPRHPGRPQSLASAAAYVEGQFAQSGQQVERHVYDNKIESMSVANLVVERLGLAKPESIVVVGAHYDSVPTTPGADDNASAVAVLIEVARCLQPIDFHRTVRFVAFTCEEPPHFYTDTMGSQVYARRCRSRSENIVGMLCLEMVGYFSDEPHSQQLPPGIPRSISWLFPKRGNFLAAVGNCASVKLAWRFDRGFRRHSTLPLFTVCLPESIREIRLSDNSSFWDQQYPALMLTDTSFLRNPHYHKSSDRAETLDFPRMAGVVHGVAGAVSHLAQTVNHRR